MGPKHYALLIVYFFIKIILWFLKGRKNMEQDVKLGSVGDLDLKLSGGKASLMLSAALPAAAASASVGVVIDAGVLVDKLFAAVEAASPPGVAPIEESVKAVVKAAVMAL